MNPYQDEFTAKYNRQRARTEIEQIRLEKLVLKSQPYRPGRFTHVMFNFANWMIDRNWQATPQALRGSGCQLQQFAFQGLCTLVHILEKYERFAT